MSLDALRSTGDKIVQGTLVHKLMWSQKRFDVVEQALDNAVIAPDLELCNEAKVVDGLVLRVETQTLLSAAAKLGATGVLRRLTLEHGLDPNTRCSDSSTPLILTIKYMAGRAALFLINEVPGVDVNAALPDGVTPLMLATSNGFLEVVKALVAKGADVNAVWRGNGNVYSHPLHLAINSKREVLALYFINEVPGVDVNAALPDGLTPLMLAASRGLLGVVKALVARGVDVNTVWRGDKDRPMYVLHLAIQFKHEAVALYLINEVPGINVDKSLGKGMTAIALAAYRGLLPVVEALVSKGVDVNTTWFDESGMPTCSLSLAIACGHEALALYLVNEVPGVQINAEIQSGSTPLMLAANTGSLPVVKALVAKGADVNIKRPSSASHPGASPLHMAIYLEHHAVALYFINEVPGVEINAAMQDGSTPLMLAEKKGMRSVVKALTGKLGAVLSRVADLHAQELLAEEEAQSKLAEKKKSQKAQKKQRRKERAKTRKPGESVSAAAADMPTEALAGGGGKPQAEGPVTRDPGVVAEAPTAVQLPIPPSAASQHSPGEGNSDDDDDVPDQYKCPLTLCLMEDPVLLMADGCTYERAAIEHHLHWRRERGLPPTSPKTGLDIDPAQAIVVPNVTVRSLILEFKETTRAALAV